MQQATDATARDAMWRAVEGAFRLGAAMVDEQGRVIDATPGLARALGLDPRAGARLADHVAAEDRGPLALALRDVAGGAPERAIRLHARPDEALELRLLRAEDPSRPLTAVVSDRREQTRVEQQLVHSERLRLLGELLLGSVHELNNLLTVIVSASDAEAPADADLALLRAAADDARRVVSRLRDFGRAPSDEPCEPVAPATLLEEALELTRVRWQQQANAAGIRIDVRTRHDACGPVAVARSEVRHALVNLIVNAIDAMPQGGVLRIASGRDGDHAVLRVADTGAGFAPEVRGRVLEPFVSTKGPRGLGLGLSLVAATVAKHGGSLAADSTPEAGTVFEIRLPLADAASSAAATEPAPAPTPAPMRILLVEDNADLRAIVARLLRREGHDVIEAESAEAALALDLAGCDAVIADLSLPGKNGLELAAALRETGRRLPLVLTSAWGVELDESLRRARGVVRVLQKPYRIDALRAALVEIQRS
jgi:signal transduction histidine kinase